MFLYNDIKIRKLYIMMLKLENCIQCKLKFGKCIQWNYNQEYIHNKTNNYFFVWNIAKQF